MRDYLFGTACSWLAIGCVFGSACGSRASGDPAGAGGAGSGGIVGGQTGTGGATGSGGATGTGGVTGSGGATASGGAPGTGGSTDRCRAPGLTWRSAAKTNYTSYPDPGSEECVKYSGCLYEGLFSACASKRPKEWVAAHSIVAVFPDFRTFRLHDLCLKSGDKTIVVTVLDECADADCSGCCTQNKGSAAQLIDVESFTDARWGVPDGPIQWADLGPTTGGGCQ